MAENKKSFILYADQAGLFQKLPDVEAGKLIKIIFDYVNDKNPKPNDLLLQVAFEPIKLQLKRDLKEWEAERSKRSEAGKKGGIKSGESRRSGSKRSSASKNEANEAVTVNVTVTDTVNDTVSKYINIELPENKISSAIEYLSITKNVTASKEMILTLWTFFKQKNFTGPENDRRYKTEAKVFSHFFETLKFEKLNGTHQQTTAKGVKPGTSTSRVETAKDWVRK